MSEFGSSRPERIVIMGGELLSRRNEIIRTLLLVLFTGASLGLLINVFAGIILLHPGNIYFYSVISISIIILMLCIYYAIKNFSGSINYKVHFELLIPFKNDTTIETINGSYYKVIQSLDVVKIFFESTSRQTQEIKNEWNQFIKEKGQSLIEKKSPHLLNFLHHLTEYIIFKAIDEFTQKSLSANACYQRFGWLRPNYKSDNLYMDKELVQLRNNMFFNQLPLKKTKFLNPSLPSKTKNSLLKSIYDT